MQVSLQGLPGLPTVCSRVGWQGAQRILCYQCVDVAGDGGFFGMFCPAKRALKFGFARMLGAPKDLKYLNVIGSCFLGGGAWLG